MFDFFGHFLALKKKTADYSAVSSQYVAGKGSNSSFPVKAD